MSARAWAVVLAAALTLPSCGARGGAREVTLRFWAMGREGEVVPRLVREFERRNPGVHVEVQQIPWSAAHEKLLTAFVGGSTPDLAQLGNSWIPEFTALHALAPLDARIARSRVIGPAADFQGIWRTNLVRGVAYGVPWYVDTRVLFYRSDLLRAAGYDSMPGSWDGWRRAMEAVVRREGRGHYAIFLPANEWLQPVVLGLQAGSPLLADSATRGAFSGPAFRRAFTFYVGLFRDSLAPAVTNNEVANMYQEFDRGTFAMVITGPWNLGEFARRLPPARQTDWMTAPLPGPESRAGGLSLAGGSSLVLFRRSRHADVAWRLMEFLSTPEQQRRFYALTGDLPARRAVWHDSALASDPRLRAFAEQLERVTSPPGVPEWEQIATLVQQHAEAAIRGAATIDQALAALDRDVDRVLSKRRWLLQRARGTPARSGP